MCSGATQQWPGADIFPLMLNVNKALNKSTQQAVFVNAGVSRWEILAVLAAKISLLASSTWLCCLLGSWQLHCFEQIINQPLKLGRTTSRKGDCGGELVLRALRIFTTNGDQVHIPCFGCTHTDEFFGISSRTLLDEDHQTRDTAWLSCTLACQPTALPLMTIPSSTCAT